jgi:uncharacterized protein (TIGR00255 family)
MALSGMTGFAREDGALGSWAWTVEARSVNGRTLEARFRGPPGFDALEKVAREGAQARFQRGQLNVSLTAKRSESAGQLRINTAQLDEYLRVGEPYLLAGKALAPSLDGLLGLRGVVEAADEADDAGAREAVEAAMAISIGHVLDALKAARLDEGRALSPILQGQVARVADLVGQAEVCAAEQPAYVRDRFKKRLAELLPDPETYEERVVQEAAVLAAKADVREELDRLSTHVAAARALLSGDQAAGRRLDFLTQEFMREANTLCSKSATTALTAVGLELKAVIEQFREQVQNVE